MLLSATSGTLRGKSGCGREGQCLEIKDVLTHFVVKISRQVFKVFQDGCLKFLDFFWPKMLSYIPENSLSKKICF